MTLVSDLDMLLAPSDISVIADSDCIVATLFKPVQELIPTILSGILRTVRLDACTLYRGMSAGNVN